MTLKPNKTLLSMAWAHFRRGYGWGIAFLLSIFASITSFTVLLKLFFPSMTITFLIGFYAITFIGIVLASIGFDFLLLRLKFIQAEMLINTRDNDVINYPIGDKEILGYKNAVAGLDREIKNYEVQIQICKALHLESQIPILERNIKSAELYRNQLQDMLNRAGIPEMWQMHKNIWLGNYSAAKVADRNKFIVVNVAQDMPNANTNDYFMPFLDNERKIHKEKLNALIDFIIKTSREKPVLVHCVNAQDRSPFVIALILAKIKGLKIDDAYAYIEEKVFPHRIIRHYELYEQVIK